MREYIEMVKRAFLRVLLELLTATSALVVWGLSHELCTFVRVSAAREVSLRDAQNRVRKRLLQHKCENAPRL